VNDENICEIGERDKSHIPNKKEAFNGLTIVTTLYTIKKMGKVIKICSKEAKGFTLFLR
jgi:hypothetical protein